MEPDQPRRPFGEVALAEFVARLSSAEPVPGGGSASAVAGSLAAGLVAMVASLSRDRPKYAEHAELHSRAEAAGHGLADRLLALADDDAAAYAAFAAALKLPRGTDEEQAVRRAALGTAATRAAEVPLEIVEACLAVVQAAEALAGRSNVNAASDLNVAALLGEAAARGAAANVAINLPSMTDADRAATLGRRSDAVLARVAEVAAATRSLVADGAVREPLAAPELDERFAARGGPGPDASPDAGAAAS